MEYQQQTCKIENKNRQRSKKQESIKHQAKDIHTPHKPKSKKEKQLGTPPAPGTSSSGAGLLYLFPHLHPVLRPHLLHNSRHLRKINHHHPPFSTTVPRPSPPLPLCNFPNLPSAPPHNVSSAPEALYCVVAAVFALAPAPRTLTLAAALPPRPAPSPPLAAAAAVPLPFPFPFLFLAIGG